MKILTPSFLLLVCFILGGIMFKSVAPTKCDRLRPDDSIFVLTGDARRIPFAMQKLRQYPNADLYIIGAGAKSTPENADRVSVESNSKSTYQNALAIREIATMAGMKRIVIVTTEDHMNRAMYLIQTELPDTEIVACPTTLTGMPPAKRLERWTIEYIKYIVTRIGIKES